MKKIFKNEIYFDKKRRNFKKRLFFMPQFKFINYKRKCECHCNNKLLYFYYRIIYEHYRVLYGIDIPAKVVIGRGFRIEHIGGIVVNPNAILGCNITLLNGVTIGSETRGKRMGAPIIGNNVWIGPNAIIVGKIIIGDDVLIVGGSFVNFDVPSHSIVIGNPGRIIPRLEATKDYIKNPIDIKDFN